MNVSIIIPTYNEEDNILPLVERIDQAAQLKQFTYEIIFVDDNSTDQTRKVITELSNKFPILLHIKKGRKGKAQSLIEGFSFAKYDILCMIDADLQYPPEAIFEMVKKVSDGTVDIVMANRSKNYSAWHRRVISAVYNIIFNKLMHNFDCDVQSGLKVFRKEIIERLPLNPSPWAFDLEFLVKARNAGYKIGNQDIVFAKRHSGKAKIGLIFASLQIGFTAIKLKMMRSDIIPFHPKTVLEKGEGFHYKGKEFIHHSRLYHSHSAFHRLSGVQIVLLIGLFSIIVEWFLIDWHLTLIVMLALLTFLYFADLLFNLYLVYRSFSKPADIQITDEEIRAIPDSAWSTYTILCPLYKEWRVIPQFVTAMSRLDYRVESHKGTETAVKICLMVPFFQQ